MGAFNGEINLEQFKYAKFAKQAWLERLASDLWFGTEEKAVKLLQKCSKR